MITALRNPNKFKSVSCFAPSCNPINSQWGKKAFSEYLGENQEDWKRYDATELSKTYTGPVMNILIDQGSQDEFLGQLLPDSFVNAKSDKIKLEYRLQQGYDHSYWFIQTFSKHS